jgi:hypothetical protein
MSAIFDHVFVLCQKGAPEADGLVTPGLEEGGGNTHLPPLLARRRRGAVLRSLPAPPAPARNALTPLGNSR